ncbi:hypothetical protein GCM10027347_38610 [Larkinella harenae]
MTVYEKPFTKVKDGPALEFYNRIVLPFYRVKTALFPYEAVMVPAFSFFRFGTMATADEWDGCQFPIRQRG